MAQSRRYYTTAKQSRASRRNIAKAHMSRFRARSPRRINKARVHRQPRLGRTM